MISYQSDEQAEFELAVWLLDRKGLSAVCEVASLCGVNEEVRR